MTHAAGTRIGLVAAAALIGCGCGDDEGAVDDAAGVIDAVVTRDAVAADGEPRADAGAPCALAGGQGGALVRVLTGDYLTGEATGTDVACAVSGGVGPYSCAIYAGLGEGTVPSGVSQDDLDPSGCRLTGGVDTLAGDVAGVYGFIVVVQDADGDQVEVPVSYQGPACDTASVTLSPPSAPVIVATAGAAQSWVVEATDVSGVDVGPPDGCDVCANMSLLTRAPLTIKLDLNCSNPGDLCSECGPGCFAGACPGPFTMTRPVELAVHTPARAGQSAWTTLEMSATYSGTSLDPCGSTAWSCHVELLETP